MYEHLVGRKFFNDFTQPHPNDIRRGAKWKIPERYAWLNLINALCYKVNKTIEFRFLRPTYNFQKIILWIYILNAILTYVVSHSKIIVSNVNLFSIIRDVYPQEIADRVILGLERLRILKNNQETSGDYIGQNIYMEEALFSKNLGL